MVYTNNFTNKTMRYILQSALSLNDVCLAVGGITPDLNMPLQDFITEYGRNGIVFALSKEKEQEIYDESRVQEAK